jgi:hypothetical protein
LYRSGIDFAVDTEVTVDPYFLGSLLADGCLRSVPIKLSCGDIEPCQYAQKVVTNMGLACRFRARKGSNCFDVFAGNDKKYGNVLRQELQKLGLWGLLGYQKFIPDVYKLGSKNVRLAMLAGLIDADGNLSIQNSVSYCATSKLSNFASSFSTPRSIVFSFHSKHGGGPLPELLILLLVGSYSCKNHILRIVLPRFVLVHTNLDDACDSVQLCKTADFPGFLSCFRFIILNQFFSGL